jgi:hypothetical protein
VCNLNSKQNATSLVARLKSAGRAAFSTIPSSVPGNRGYSSTFGFVSNALQAHFDPASNGDAQRVVVDEVENRLGLELSNLRTTVSGNDLEAAVVNVKNVSGKAIRAFAVVWEIEAQGVKERLSITETWDAFADVDGLVPLGEVNNLAVRSFIRSKVPLSTVRVAPQYVEFSDGTSLGDRQSSAAVQLKARREDTIKLFQEIHSMSQKNDPASLKAFLIGSQAAGVSVGRKSAAAILLPLLESAGVDGIRKKTEPFVRK